MVAIKGLAIYSNREKIKNLPPPANRHSLAPSSGGKVRFSLVLHHIFPNPEPDFRVRFWPPLELEPEPRVQVRFRFEPSLNLYYYNATITHELVQKN